MDYKNEEWDIKNILERHAYYVWRNAREEIEDDDQSEQEKIEIEALFQEPIALEMYIASESEEWGDSNPSCSHQTKSIIIQLKDEEVVYERCIAAKLVANIGSSEEINDEKAYLEAIRKRDILRRRNKQNGSYHDPMSIQDIHTAYETPRKEVSDFYVNGTFSLYYGFTDTDYTQIYQYYSKQLMSVMKSSASMTFKDLAEIENRYKLRKQTQTFVQWVRIIYTRQ